MNLSYTAFILFSCSLIQCLSGLRLIKVVIPAYKLRGESTYLECQYELKKSPNTSKSSSSGSSMSSSIGTSSSSSSSSGGGVGGGINMYSSDDMDINSSSYQRSKTYQNQHYQNLYQHQQLLLQQQQQQQQQQQDQYNHEDQNIYKIYEEQGLRNHHHYPTYDNIDENHSNDGSEALYAVKWYKDNEEFYRYVPKANPTKQSYQVDGIRVDEKHSDSTRVVLRGLTLNSTGLYKCEVSAEAPNFSSVQGQGRMEIVYLPRDGPHIKGKEDQYQIGDTLNLNCTSGKSHPASRLQWFINDELLTDSNSLIYYNDTVHKHGLITSTLGLQLIVDARHFQDGAMRVKCVAKVSPVLWKGDKESILQRRPNLGLIDREAMLLVLSSSSYLADNISKSCILIGVIMIYFVNNFINFQLINFHIR